MRDSRMGSRALWILCRVTPVPNVSGPIKTGSVVCRMGSSREYPGVSTLATLLLVASSAPWSAVSPLRAMARPVFRLDKEILPWLHRWEPRYRLRQRRRAHSHGSLRRDWRWLRDAAERASRAPAVPAPNAIRGQRLVRLPGLPQAN